MAKITGADKHSARLKRMSGPAAFKLVEQALFVAGQMIEVEAEISITTGSVSGKNHVPSKPGDPPNADTRTLDTNIETIVVSGNEPTVHVSSNAPYSQALEFGTSKMAERPFMRPATAKKRDEATALIRKAVDKANRG